MAYFVTGIIGANPDTTYTGTSTAGAGAPYTLGTVAAASDGNTYIFVQASAAVARYAAAFINTTFQMSELTKAVAAANSGRPVFPQVAFAQYDFGWAVLHGSSFRVKFADSCAKNVMLFTTDTAGVVDDATASTSQYLIVGLAFDTVSGNTASAGLACGAFPHIRRALTE